MLTGSFASSYHGLPRSTQDVALVVSADAGRIRLLAQLLDESEFYVSEEAALDALRRESQFNAIDLATGWKFDLILLKDRPFSREEFERRRPVELFGVPIFLASAEDVLIAKLEWAKAGASERQLDDAAGILRARGSELERAYLEHWVADLDLGEEWRRACQRAEQTGSL